MNVDVKIIQEKKDFEESHRLINQVFRTERRIPDQVFNPSLSGFLFEEFDWAMSSEFWKTIQQLAIASKDSYILTAVLEPSPTDYFFNEFGCYNWFKLPVGITADDYWSVLQSGPKGSPADALLYNSEIVVWVSPSMKWAIWGERSYGICVLAFANGVEKSNKASLLGAWRNASDALKDLISFKDGQNPKAFSEFLMLNYQ